MDTNNVGEIIEMIERLNEKILFSCNISERSLLLYKLERKYQFLNSSQIRPQRDLHVPIFFQQLFRSNRPITSSFKPLLIPVNYRSLANTYPNTISGINSPRHRIHWKQTDSTHDSTHQATLVLTIPATANKFSLAPLQTKSPVQVHLTRTRDPHDSDRVHLMGKP